MNKFLDEHFDSDNTIDAVFRKTFQAERQMVSIPNPKIWRRIQQRLAWQATYAQMRLQRAHFSVEAINHPIARMCTIFSMSGRAAGLV